MISKRAQVLKMVIKALEADGIVFGNDPHTLSSSQSNELYEWAVGVAYKGSKMSPLSMGRQFYQRLSRLKQVE